MHRWKKSGKETPLVYQQVAKCMEIGLLCQEIDPSRRPFIWDLIHDIREMDSVNGTISTVCEYMFGQISPYSEDDMLGVEPLELHFPFELNKQMSCSLKLTNQTDAYIAFNIQKMSPLPYCTRPNKDIVLPQSKCSVDITLHPQDKVPRDMQRAEEFIVWSTKVNDSLAAEDITINMFSKESGVVDAINLDVVFDAEESTKVRKELIPSITEDMSNNGADDKVGDVKKCHEGMSPMPLSGSSAGNQNYQEAVKEFGEKQEASAKTNKAAPGDPVVEKSISMLLGREPVSYSVLNYGDNPTKVREFVKSYNALHKMGFASLAVPKLPELLLITDKDLIQFIHHLLTTL